MFCPAEAASRPSRPASSISCSWNASGSRLLREISPIVRAPARSGAATRERRPRLKSCSSSTYSGFVMSRRYTVWPRATTSEIRLFSGLNSAPADIAPSACSPAVAMMRAVPSSESTIAMRSKGTSPRSSRMNASTASSRSSDELSGLVPFDRMAIVLSAEGTARIIATAGEQADGAMSAGAEFSPENSLISDVVARGQTVYRRDMTKPEYVEEEQLFNLGLRSRVAAPLLAGARTIGLISLSRREPDAFQEHEIELAGLLGRLAASAGQNIRAYESERRTVEELRRLSALREDFVSLVSHELRSPMAAVIGAARTLQARWHELQPDQRESFLALIGDETTRLAALIGDVLATSRIDAGTFSYRFSDVDIAALVRDAVATAAVGQDEVPIVIETAPDAVVVRGDPERLRQIFGNLIDNAVKYSPAGERA